MVYRIAHHMIKGMINPYQVPLRLVDEQPIVHPGEELRPASLHFLFKLNVFVRPP